MAPPPDSPQNPFLQEFLEKSGLLKKDEPEFPEIPEIPPHLSNPDGAEIPDEPALSSSSSDFPETPSDPIEDPLQEPVLGDSLSPSEPLDTPADALPGALDDAPIELPAESVASDPLSEAPESAPESSLPPPPSSEEVVAEIKDYSENISPASAAAPAAVPFHLYITGHLNDHEKEKLLDILSRENMGIREMDLEPQLSEGKILIPRISEYAGVLLIQALRGSATQMLLAPSDGALEPASSHIFPEVDPSHSQSSSWRDANHPAERIPVTPDSTIPNLPDFIVVDTIIVSSALNTEFIEAERSPKYQDLIDSLKKELKYKAHRKGAHAILKFQIQTDTLTLPSRYRITLSGLAVRAP